MPAKQRPKGSTVIVNDAQALALRTAGASYDQIARQMGYANRSGAHHAVRRALEAAMAQRNLDAEHLIELENERLDAMQVGIWRQATSGTYLAIDRVLRIMERRAALNGYDAPKRSEVSGPGGEAIQIEQTVDVNVSLEERRARVLAFISERAGSGLGGTHALPGPDLDTAGRSADERMADAG